MCHTDLSWYTLVYPYLYLGMFSTELHTKWNSIDPNATTSCWKITRAGQSGNITMTWCVMGTLWLNTPSEGWTHHRIQQQAASDGRWCILGWWMSFHGSEGRYATWSRHLRKLASHVYDVYPHCLHYDKDLFVHHYIMHIFVSSSETEQWNLVVWPSIPTCSRYRINRYYKEIDDGRINWRMLAQTAKVK